MNVFTYLTLSFKNLFSQPKKIQYFSEYCGYFNARPKLLVKYDREISAPKNNF